MSKSIDEISQKVEEIALNLNELNSSTLTKWASYKSEIIQILNEILRMMMIFDERIQPIEERLQERDKVLDDNR
jgi:uncharacterized protein YfkK (UPF0435 family)